MEQNLRLLLLTLLSAVVNLAWGDTKTATLTNANIVAAGDATSIYKSWTITDENGKSWSAYAIKDKHSNATSGNHFLQIKKYASNTAYYIQVPEYGAKITSITMTVSSTQKPMTDGGNTATLFFSASNQTAATGTGVASGTGESSVTIDCSSLNLNTGYITASGAVRIWDVEVTYEEGSAKADPKLAFTPTTVTLNVGETADVTFSNPNDLDVEFTNEDETIATYANGVVTALKAGTTTITATSEGTELYNAGEAVLTITVTAAAEMTTFYKVDNANMLVAGNEFILVAEEYNKAMAGVNAANANIRDGIDVTITDNTIKVDESKVAVLTLGGSNDAYTFLASDNNKYLALTSNSNNLNSADNATAATAQWTISDEFTVYNKNFSSRWIAWNNSFTRFATYTGTQTKTVLYVKEDYKTDDSNPGLAIEDVRMSLDDGQVPLAITTKSDGDITFESSDEGIATVETIDGNYVVIAVGSGKCTITATQEATDDYSLATFTFSVLVTSDKASGVYKMVTSTSELVANKQYIIVAPDHNKALGGQNNNYRKAETAKVLEIGTDKYVTITDNAPVTMLTLGGSEGAWTFLTYDELNYLSLPSEDNYLKTENEVTDKSKWTIKDDLTIWNNKYNQYSLQYNSASNQERFTCYKEISNMKPTYLFVKVESIPVDITKVGYGTLYYSDKDLIVPSGVKAMTYKLTTSGDDIRILDTYEAGDIIPKDCGVVLQALNESDKTQTFHFAEGTALDVAPEDNILYGSDEPTMTNEIVEGDNLYYVLSTDKNGENVGFYWGAKKGAAFMNGAHKAFLAIPKSSGVNASSFVFDELTGIRAITIDSAEGAEGVYTLSGMRIDGKQLPKGIYIVNGKKMVIK